jgi:hypothetical protein
MISLLINPFTCINALFISGQLSFCIFYVFLCWLIPADIGGHQRFTSAAHSALSALSVKALSCPSSISSAVAKRTEPYRILCGIALHVSLSPSVSLTTGTAP